jgi:hypothetical protein
MTVKASSTPAFEALLGDLQTLAKATDVNQERIAAGRAAEGYMQEGTTMAKSEEEKKKEKEAEERRKEEEGKKAANAHGGKEGKEMAKSFSIKTDDGNTIEVQDASDLLKALGVRLDETTTTVQNALGSVVNVMKAQGEMLKSLTDKFIEQGATLAAQDTLIKSLQGDVTKLGTAPAGRKAVVTVAERQTATATETMAKAGMPEGVTTDAFFAKCFDMQKHGQMTGMEISIAEASINAGQAVPAYIVQKVAAAK